MKQEMILCDRPDCEEVSSDAYGWVVGDLTWWGSGPTVHVEVCSEACLPDGLEAARDRQEYEEHERRREQEAALNAAVLTVQCRTCGAAPDMQCCSRHGKISLHPHAPRIKDGRDAL